MDISLHAAVWQWVSIWYLSDPRDHHLPILPLTLFLSALNPSRHQIQWDFLFRMRGENVSPPVSNMRPPVQTHSLKLFFSFLNIIFSKRFIKQTMII